MQIITMGKNIEMPKTEYPNMIVGCNSCNSVYKINLNDDCRKKYYDAKRKMFIWLFDCLCCEKEISIGVNCNSIDKALFYAKATGNKWVK